MVHPARRGSLFKLFVYLTAFQKGASPQMAMVDRPVQIGNWEPENYGGGFRGQVTLRNCLRQDGAVRSHCDERGLTDFLCVAFALQPTRNDAFGDALQIEIEGGAQCQIFGYGADEPLYIAVERIHETK